LFTTTTQQPSPLPPVATEATKSQPDKPATTKRKPARGRGRKRGINKVNKENTKESEQVLDKVNDVVALLSTTLPQRGAAKNALMKMLGNGNKPMNGGVNATEDLEAVNAVKKRRLEV
jgi:hypothetical protein